MLDRVFHKGKMWEVVTRFYKEDSSGRIKIQRTNELGQAEDDLLFTSEVKVLNSWIGLNDREGRAIYGGDVVKWRYMSTDVYDLVSWDVQRAGYLPFIGTESFDGLIYPDAREVEVVGNIYESPDLLKLTQPIAK